MDPTPDACNQSHMKMEMDGWYADLANFSCGEESYRAMACGGTGGKRGCQDRIVMKGGGGPLGYPLKQTTTMTTPQGTFTMTTEVIDIEKTSLDDPLFDAPPGCKTMGGSGTVAAAPPDTTPAAETKAAAPTPAAAPAPTTPSAPPKAAGAIRVGVVAIKDATGESLPIDSMQLDLLGEFARNQIDTVQLSDGPVSAIQSEAKDKQCDYIVFTVPTVLKDPNTGGIAATSLPKGTKLDPAKYQALTLVTLYKVGKPAPELKDAPLAADADKFGVDAVTNTFVQESNRVAQQISDDAHPKATAKPATKPGTKSSGGTKTK
jgi:hypothetical protein